jgi:hypothetical protein
VGDAESVKVVWKPNAHPLDQEKAETLLKLVDGDEDDDVQNVFSNRIFLMVMAKLDARSASLAMIPASAIRAGASSRRRHAALYVADGGVIRRRMRRSPRVSANPHAACRILQLHAR